MKKLSHIFNEEYQESLFIVKDPEGRSYPCKFSLEKASQKINKGFVLYHGGEKVEDDLGFFFE